MNSAKNPGRLALHSGLCAVAAISFAAQAAESSSAAAHGNAAKAVTLQAIPGTTAKRVILAQKAAERLGIEVGKVREEPIMRKQMVGGLVVASTPSVPQASSGGSSGFSGFTQIAATPAAQPAPKAVDGTWLMVSLSHAEWERLAKDKPARVLPLSTREGMEKEAVAQFAGLPPYENVKRSMLNVYYVVPGKEHSLTPNKRVRVELQQAGSEGVQKVVPYGALYYDAKGQPWVYVTSQPLTYERQRVRVERVVGERAVLSDGPPVGTQVVTVGAALLYGAEIFGK